MAARRLIIVMLVLLGISTAVAIVAPDPAERAAESGTTGSTTTEQADDRGSTGTTGQSGGDSESKGQADGRNGTDSDQAPGTIRAGVTVSDSGKNASVCARPGSRLVLTVRTSEPLDVAIPEFGRTATITPYAPELFDLVMPEESGRYDIEALGTGRAIGRIINDDNCKSPRGTSSD